MAFIYIEHHLDDLKNMKAAKTIHQNMRSATLQESLKKHVHERVERCYPERIYDDEGAIIPELTQMVQEQLQPQKKPSQETAFEFKQPTMPDAATSAEELFSHARPVLVVPEASTESALAPAVTAEYSMGKLAAMDVTMSNRFEDQWVTKYLTRISLGL